jgi:hypothetical protein
MSNDVLKREIKRLRDRLVQRDFRAGAPPLDEDGLPVWGDSEPLSVDGYTKALGPSPDEQLSAEELAARQHLSPYLEVFERLERDATEKAEEARM